jgi:diguanylate cyclase (GGDEF)-like protein
MIPGQIYNTATADDITDVRSLTILPGLSHRPVDRGLDESVIDVTDDIDATVEPTEREAQDDLADFDTDEVRLLLPLQRESESDPFGPGDKWDVTRRSGFIAQLEDRLQSGESLAMVAIGLDRFHTLNLAEGMEIGDAVIRNTHRVLRWMLGPGNVAYFGSDCFAVLLPYDGKSTTEMLDAALDQLACTDLSDEMTDVYATASAGMVVVDEAGATVDAVLFEAQRLMLLAKEMGGNGAVVEDLPTQSLGAMSA